MNARYLRSGFLSALCLALQACQPAPVVGTWLIHVPEAPFPFHMFAFHADGTVLQSNPDAGDANTSDSSAMGAWVAERGGVRGKIVEITADRTTRQFMSRGEISFSLTVTGDALHGTAVANFYDASGHRVRGPVQATLTGQRVLP